MREDVIEYICCSAIWIDTGVPAARRSYAYPETGLLFCGLRHSDCLTILEAWYDLLSEEEQARMPHLTKHQGFLTSRGRYVDRKEGLEIALSTGQVLREDLITGRELYSEDLY